MVYIGDWNRIVTPHPGVEFYLHPPPGRFTVAPKALIKTDLLGRPINKHKNDHPFDPVISALKLMPKGTVETGEKMLG